MKPDGAVIETGLEHKHDSFILENKVKKIQKEVLQVTYLPKLVYSMGLR